MNQHVIRFQPQLPRVVQPTVIHAVVVALGQNLNLCLTFVYFQNAVNDGDLSPLDFEDNDLANAERSISEPQK